MSQSSKMKPSQARDFSRAQSIDESTDEESRGSHRKRRLTVYDVVAGRANRQRFISHSTTSRWRRNVSSARAVRPSNDILSRLGGEDFDDWIDDESPDHVHLPESDILEAVQSYAGHFYANTGDNRRTEHFSSMNGSALIAMGILLEELGNELLGETGDMVLVEREDGDNYDSGHYASDASITSSAYSGKTNRKRSASVMSRGTPKHMSGTEEEPSSSRKRGKNKKPRIDKSAARSTDTETEHGVDAVSISDD
ncbi:Meiotic nuclear division protein 1 [Talaromyces marneffei ATCC 18224]|uniref:Uncharacterized protein n=1 Tax=Talaromyces marneffei (strain ATCC 18224 / CBS 334.59 / QM 7333) TaxID=441960 RepID=B6QL48_TALMQ|nr:conserved hypothetical protein [Talaromyces marneffei ATCC 18224]KAE8550703.1 hypothetical protein EYB25_006931 [Talaromyces marneffei]